MDVEDDSPKPEGLESRAPTESDLAQLCRRLNEEKAAYVVGRLRDHSGSVDPSSEC